MKTFVSRISLIILFFCCFNKSQAQLVINEYSCSNISTLQDNFNNYEDWIELYNKGNAAVSLAGYYLSDDKSRKNYCAVTIILHGLVIILLQ